MLNDSCFKDSAEVILNVSTEHLMETMLLTKVFINTRKASQINQFRWIRCSMCAELQKVDRKKELKHNAHFELFEEF